ncbi:MAG: flagellar basal body P-ring protein FlgI [Phycisphaerae bacterium]|nr:flagellar basal body P-ring protein FlgI [Phycisphaerae bacterium]
MMTPQMRTTRWFLAGLALLALTAPAGAERIKDITTIKGARGNPLWGYGVVIGLDGTGDNSTASRQALTNILRREGLVLDPDDVSSDNIASVIVTAELGSFDRRGSRLDVTVSTIGSASSLRGGTLLMTELKGADGQVYAVVQQPVTVGGFSATGDASSVTSGHATVARIPDGAIVEREEIGEFVENDEVTLLLRNPDFATAERVAEAINAVHTDAATAADAGTVRVAVPEAVTPKTLAGFIRKIRGLDVKVDYPARVVVNEKTGTVIVGQNVRISEVAISHGNLSIVTEEREEVSQPSPFSRTGTTEKTKKTDIRVIEERSKLEVIPRGASVADLARALNSMGLTPRDIIAIFQALKQAGALQAELKVM